MENRFVGMKSRGERFAVLHDVLKSLGCVCVFVNDVNMFSPSHVKICLFVLSAFLSGNGKLGEEAEKSFRFVL